MASISKQSSNSDQGTEPTDYETGSDDHRSGSDGYVTPNEEFEPEEENEDLPEEVEAKVKKALGEAEDIKSMGSEYFRTREWHEALQEYQRALSLLPVRPAARNKGKEKEKDGGESEEILEVQLSELEQECAKARAVLNGNIGACYVKLGDHEKVVQACTAALLDDPKYVKVLHRRALSNDVLGTWTSLTSAEQDYTSLVDILPAHSSLLPEIHSALRNLVPRKEAAQSAEMTEMMGKLKGLGNNILGNFGLSTDNFKFEPNGQGGYSVECITSTKMLRLDSPIPFISISPAPPKEPSPIGPQASPFVFPLAPVTSDSPRPQHLLPPPSPYHRAQTKRTAGTVNGRGIDRSVFQMLLQSARVKKVEIKEANKSTDICQVAFQTQTKQIERRARFLAKLAESPKASAIDTPATPPESPAVFHFSLPSPGLESPCEVSIQQTGRKQVERVEHVNFYAKRPAYHSLIPVISEGTTRTSLKTDDDCQTNPRAAATKALFAALNRRQALASQNNAGVRQNICSKALEWRMRREETPLGAYQCSPVVLC